MLDITLDSQAIGIKWTVLFMQYAVVTMVIEVILILVSLGEWQKKKKTLDLIQ